LLGIHEEHDHGNKTKRRLVAVRREFMMMMMKFDVVWCFEISFYGCFSSRLTSAPSTYNTRTRESLLKNDTGTGQTRLSGTYSEFKKEFALVTTFYCDRVLAKLVSNNDMRSKHAKITETSSECIQ
jgi:hypothetical protein